MSNRVRHKCIVEGCVTGNYAKGYCYFHYIQKIKGEIFSISPHKETECKIKDCNNLVFRMGLCGKHFSRKIFFKNPEARVVGDINDYTIEDNIVKMNLYSKREKIAENIFDLQFLDLVKDKKWYLGKDGYPSGKINGKIYKFHKYILNDLDNQYVYDHIDKNKLNNCLTNLRQTTQKVNTWNSSIGKNNKTGFTGVHQTSKGKYVAQITNNRKAKHLGTFKTLEDAIIAYKKEELIIRGANFGC